MYFFVPDDYRNYHKIIDGKKMVRVSTSCWFTSLPVNKHNEFLTCYKRYSPAEYPKYDNYDAINIDKYTDIPYDYDGCMGVPITFLDKYNPEQFHLIGATESEGKGFSNGLWKAESKVAQPLVKGEKRYKRIFIKKAKH